MSRRSQWGAMHDRVAQGHAAPTTASPSRSEAPSPSGVPTALKHCWVSDENGRLPGLLLQWRRMDSGYEGRVVRPVHDAELGWIVVEEWLPASCLERA